MNGRGKLKSVKGGKNKRLAKCKSFFIWAYVASLFFVCIADKYMTVPVYASEGETTIDYYTPSQVGDIKLGDIVISMQNASGFTVTDQNYINAIKNNMNGSDQDIAHIMEMTEADAVQYLNVCINNAQSAGATKLQNSLSISSEMADYLNTNNTQGPDYNVVQQDGGQHLYDTIRATYKQNTENQDIISRGRAVIQNALKLGSDAWLEGITGLPQLSRDIANWSLTGLAGTMFGVPGAAVAGLQSGLFTPNVKHNAPVTTPDNILDSVGEGYNLAGVRDGNYYSYWRYPIGSQAISYRIDVEFIQESFAIYKCTLKSGTGYRSSNGGSWQSGSFSSGSRPTSSILGMTYTINGNSFGFLRFDSQESANAYVNSLANGTEQAPDYKSPDIVGNQGNINFDPDNQSININQVYDPADNYFLPIKIGSDSYGDYINNLNQNTTNNNYGQNGNVYNNYITNNYITNAPSVPEPTPTPIVPDQPVVPDIPSIEDITPEEAQELIDNMLPDLRNFFPFCIPFDVLAIAQAFSSDNREAPVFDWDLPLGVYGTQHIHLDLSQWDDIAALLRALELALFILGLMQFARAVDTKD